MHMIHESLDFLINYCFYGRIQRHINTHTRVYRDTCTCTLTRTHVHTNTHNGYDHRHFLPWQSPNSLRDPHAHICKTNASSSFSTCFSFFAKRPSGIHFSSCSCLGNPLGSYKEETCAKGAIDEDVQLALISDFERPDLDTC